MKRLTLIFRFSTQCQYYNDFNTFLALPMEYLSEATILFFSFPFLFRCPLCPFSIFLLLCMKILSLEVSVMGYFYLKCHSWTYPGGHTSRRETLLPPREIPGSTLPCIKMLVYLDDFPGLTAVLAIGWPWPTQPSAVLHISLKNW